MAETFEERRERHIRKTCEKYGWEIAQGPVDAAAINRGIWMDCGIRALGEMLDELLARGR